MAAIAFGKPWHRDVSFARIRFSGNEVDSGRTVDLILVWYTGIPESAVVNVIRLRRSKLVSDAFRA